ncbi:MAG: bifunctional DNA primase/polymerase [Clostridia bacterium]|nr:bifunctional DNA primase/polymerase [Clostridia bacterium]
MIYNYDDLLNRYANITIDGKETPETAFNILQDQTTPELLTRLKADALQHEKDALNGMIKTFHDLTAKGHDGETLLTNWKRNTPAYLYGALLQALKPAYNDTPRTSSGDALQDYVIKNIGLYPCTQNARPLCKIYDESKNIIDANKIKDVETLQSWKNKNVSLFAFYPAHNNFIVLDLDNSDEHANTTNGIKNFLDLIAGVEMADQYKNYFKDFPRNFPCYVETPHNGIHLYFKASYIPNNWTPNKGDLNALNIEIKYNNQVTAGGSIRDGKQYILRGNLDDAPRMNIAIIDLLTKGRPQPIKKPAGSYKPKDGELWNATPDGIISKAQELYFNDTPHYFVMKTAVLFKKAGFTKELATEYITQTPQHIGRKNKADTLTAITSVF